MRLSHQKIDRSKLPAIFVGVFTFVCFVNVTLAQNAAKLDSYAEAVRIGTDEVKRDALLALQRIGTESSARVAIAGLRDTNPVIRATAIGALRGLPGEERATIVLPYLTDKNPFVRKESAYALGGARNEIAVAALIKALESDKNREVRSAAAVALGESGSPVAINALTRVLEKKPKKSRAFLRRAISKSIGQIALGFPRGRATPTDFLPLSTKVEWERAFPNLQIEKLKRILLRVLSSKKESPDTRREAAFAYGVVVGTHDDPNLIQCTRSTDPFLSEICREAILQNKKLRE